MEEHDKKIAAAALLIVAGGVVGAGLALLFAPQSGKRTRKDISRYAKKARHRADETIEEISSNISCILENVEEKTDELVEKGRETAGTARKDLIRLIEEGASRLETFRTRLSRM